MSKISIGDSLPQTSLAILDVAGPVAHLTMRRDDVFNALNPQLIDDITQLLEWTRDRSVAEQGSLTDGSGAPFLRVVVLSGAGPHFCAGAEIDWMRASGAQSAEENRADAARLDRLFNSLHSHPCFTIGNVQGVALGGGAGLVACCDHVIVESDARIALSEGKLGILPAVIGPYVHRRIGSAQTRRLATLAKRIDAAEALRIGMVDEECGSVDDFPAATQVVIDEILSTGPAAVAEAKRLVAVFDRWSGSDEELREWTLDKTSEMRGSAEGQDGLSAFLDGGTPSWYVSADEED